MYNHSFIFNTKKTTIMTTYDYKGKYDLYVSGKFPMIVTSTKKPTIYKMKDRLITYEINLSRIHCQCLTSDEKMCDHIFYLLVKNFGVSLEYMMVFNRHRDKFTETIEEYKTKRLKREDVGKILNSYIETEHSSIDCGICMSSIVTFEKTKTFKCPKCDKFTHSLCQRKWFEKRNKTCVYCIEQIIS